jgi:acyl-CoA hydrolase
MSAERVNLRGGTVVAVQVVDIAEVGPIVAAAVTSPAGPGGSSEGGSPAEARVPRVVCSGNFAVPLDVLAALEGSLERYRLYAINVPGGLPDREGVTLETSFVGAGMRRKPQLSYVPARLSLVPRLFATTLPPDVVVIHTTTPRDDAVSLGIEVNILPGAIDAARARGALVVAQLNAQMPWTGGDAVVPLEAIDYGVEVDEPLASPPSGVLDDASAAIGEAVAARVSDGACLQLGIGAVPDAVLAGLRRRRGLSVWSEMFSDGVLALEVGGCLDPDQPLVASFLFGSPELYAWVDGNERVLMRRTEVTNEPAQIARRPLMTSVNTALQVDLFAQANASRIDARIFSGFGGQTDFIVGALHAPGGQAIMALRSWHPKADVSTIIPLVDEPVTSFQPTAVVTEQGVAQIWGLSEKDQARNLIECAAHPRIRAELWEEAAELGLSEPSTR